MNPDLLLIPPAIYIPITVIIYGLIIYVINFSSSKKKYNSEFFILFTWLSVAAVVDCVTTSLWLRVSNSKVFLFLMAALPEKSVFLTLIPFLSYMSNYAMLFLDVTLSFNRVTVMLLKTKYNMFWQRALRWSLIIVLILSLAFTWHFWFTDVAIVPSSFDPDTGKPTSYIFDQQNKSNIPWMDNQQFSLITEFFVTICGLVGNSYVAVHLIMFKANNNKMNKFPELKLFVYTLFSSSSYLLMSLVQLVLYFKLLDSVLQVIVYTYGMFFIDFATLGPAYFMMLINSSLRNDVFRRCGLPHSRNDSTVVSIRTVPTTIARRKQDNTLFQERSRIQ